MTALLSCQHDDEVVAQEDPPEDDEVNLSNDMSENLQVVLSAIDKVVTLHTIS